MDVVAVLQIVVVVIRLIDAMVDGMTVHTENGARRVDRAANDAKSIPPMTLPFGKGSEIGLSGEAKLGRRITDKQRAGRRRNSDPQHVGTVGEAGDRDARADRRDVDVVFCAVAAFGVQHPGLPIGDEYQIIPLTGHQRGQSLKRKAAMGIGRTGGNRIGEGRAGEPGVDAQQADIAVFHAFRHIAAGKRHLTQQALGVRPVDPKCHVAAGAREARLERDGRCLVTRVGIGIRNRHARVHGGATGAIGVGDVAAGDHTRDEKLLGRHCRKRRAPRWRYGSRRDCLRQR